MAKADHVEWQKCMDFANNLEDRVRDLDDEKLGRTLYGYRVLVDNACDPVKDTLEWKPEIAAAIAAYKQPEAVAETANGALCEGAKGNDEKH